MSLRTVFVICLMTVTTSACSSSSIKPFASDGCSSFPDGTFKQSQLWLNCCTAHDYAYWRGGSYDERLQADKELRSCVAAVGEPELAVLMLAGVRAGGTPFLPTNFRWGYGWPYPKFYGALTDDELSQIKEREADATAIDR